ncbi:MAG: Stp1/IreP family PP2C-type Ser/Thr phosphatase [Blastocatellia bacterium]|nr:Stp1/IreP family PP2C-type Ser/Thr phosphatase [Blastocatellia bacterium]
MTASNSGLITTNVAGITDVGLRRKNNEDNFLIADLTTGRVFLIPQRIGHRISENRLLLAVSDGVGGASSGEVASSMAVHSMRVELLRRTKAPLSPFDRLVQAVEKANSLIWSESQANPERRGMAATITAALIEKNVAYIAEVGDSRGYIVHSGRIKQITTDQSLVGMMIERGLLTPEQAKTSPGRNIILQSLGYQSEVKVAVTSVELTVGDYLLLCSDGLSNKIKDEEMLDYVTKHDSVEDTCKALIELAKERGGEDNITAVLARFEGDGLKPAEYVSRLTTHIEILAAFDPDTPRPRNVSSSGTVEATPTPNRQPTTSSYTSVSAGKSSTQTTPTTLPHSVTKLEAKKEATAKQEPVLNVGQELPSEAKPKAGSTNPDAYKTRELSSERKKSEGYFTLSFGSSNAAPLFSKYSRDQLYERNNIAHHQINLAMDAILQQLEGFRSLLYWTEQNGEDGSTIASYIRRLESFLRTIESQHLSAEEARSIVEKFSR